MSDLEKSLADWRKQMVAAGVKRPVPLEELEIHVREEIERQVKSGINAQRAFDNAVQQIGKANMLKSEFGKIAGTKDLRVWRQTQMMFFFGLGIIVLFITACVIFKLGSFADFSPAQQISGLAAVSVLLLLAGGGYFGHGFLPVILDKRRREAICIFSGVLMSLWWAVFFWGVLPRVDFTTSQLNVAILWGFVAPFGLLAGVTVGLEKVARRNSIPASQ